MNTPDRTDSKVTADLAVTAEFAINQYTLIYDAGENGTISGADSQTVDYGGDASAVTAVAKKGYHFVAWSDGITTAQRIDSKVMGRYEGQRRLCGRYLYRWRQRVGVGRRAPRWCCRNNGGDDLEIAANGAFQIRRRVACCQHLQGDGTDPADRAQSDLHGDQRRRG